MMHDSDNFTKLQTLMTNHDKGEPGCKSMANYAIQYDSYLRNSYYFQLKIEENYDDP